MMMIWIKRILRCMGIDIDSSCCIFCQRDGRSTSCCACVWFGRVKLREVSVMATRSGQLPHQACMKLLSLFCLYTFCHCFC